MNHVDFMLRCVLPGNSIIRLWLAERLIRFGANLAGLSHQVELANKY